MNDKQQTTNTFLLFKGHFTARFTLTDHFSTYLDLRFASTCPANLLVVGAAEEAFVVVIVVDAAEEAFVEVIVVALEGEAVEAAVVVEGLVKMFESSSMEFSVLPRMYASSKHSVVTQGSIHSSYRA